MKNYTMQQEILLVTNNTFSQNRWCEKNGENDKELSQAEQLEEACWNGLINELLPEIIERPDINSHLYLWQIKRGEGTLQLDLSEYPFEIEGEFSIDINLFMTGRDN